MKARNLDGQLVVRLTEDQEDILEAISGDIPLTCDCEVVQYPFICRTEDGRLIRASRDMSNSVYEVDEVLELADGTNPNP